jgi:hypothetical protein
MDCSFLFYQISSWVRSSTKHTYREREGRGKEMDEWMDGWKKYIYIYRYKVDCTNQLKKKKENDEREFDMLN